MYEPGRGAYVGGDRKNGEHGSRGFAKVIIKIERKWSRKYQSIFRQNIN